MLECTSKAAIFTGSILLLFHSLIYCRDIKFSLIHQKLAALRLYIRLWRYLTFELLVSADDLVVGSWCRISWLDLIVDRAFAIIKSISNTGGDGRLFTLVTITLYSALLASLRWLQSTALRSDLRVVLIEFIGESSVLLCLGLLLDYLPLFIFLGIICLDC